MATRRAHINDPQRAASLDGRIESRLSTNLPVKQRLNDGQAHSDPNWVVPVDGKMAQKGAGKLLRFEHIKWAAIFGLLYSLIHLIAVEVINKHSANVDRKVTTPEYVIRVFDGMGNPAPNLNVLVDGRREGATDPLGFARITTKGTRLTLFKDRTPLYLLTSTSTQPVDEVSLGANLPDLKIIALTWRQVAKKEVRPELDQALKLIQE
jgi:hypothetical protein